MSVKKWKGSRVWAKTHLLFSRWWTPKKSERRKVRSVKPTYSFKKKGKASAPEHTASIHHLSRYSSKHTMGQIREPRAMMISTLTCRWTCGQLQQTILLRYSSSPSTRLRIHRVHLVFVKTIVLSQRGLTRTETYRHSTLTRGTSSWIDWLEWARRRMTRQTAYEIKGSAKWGRRRKAMAQSLNWSIWNSTKLPSRRTRGRRSTAGTQTSWRSRMSRNWRQPRLSVVMPMAETSQQPASSRSPMEWNKPFCRISNFRWAHTTRKRYRIWRDKEKTRRSWAKKSTTDPTSSSWIIW